MSSNVEKTTRFDFIDQYRGLIGILMLLGHCSYYLNSIWINLDPFDPLFASWDQFALRYIGYICAPGFLMMNGAMVYWAYKRRIEKGVMDWSARWHLIQRGLFLIFVQITWVNSSWSGFASFRPWHLGIISTIGFSMILLTFIINLRWQIRLGIALAILLVHPFLLNIYYDPNQVWAKVLMQTFIDSGEFNKYPIPPWFALAIMGSVVAQGWFLHWKTGKQRIIAGIVISVSALVIASIIRMIGGFGNIFPFSEFGSISFFLDQKYPPSIYQNLWFFGAVVMGVTIIIAIGKTAPKLVSWLGIVGKVPLFFYCVHIGLLGIFSKRIGIFYREGEVAASLIGFIMMLIVMLPLAKWFGVVKQKSKNKFIRLI